MAWPQPPKRSTGIVLLILLAGHLWICSAVAAAGTFSVKGSCRLLGAFSFNPDMPELYSNTEDALTAAVFRAIVTGRISPSLSFELNAINDFNHSSAPLAGSAFITAGQVPPQYRYPDLDWHYNEAESVGDTVQGTAGIDRLNLKYSTGPIDLTVGRQPVTLATCFLFTPNDFFHPFSPQSFNKIYKPGVDAIQMRWFTGELSEITVIGVCGYTEDHENPSWDESATLLRGITSFRGFEWTVFAGKIAGHAVTGLSIQGELLGLGVRAEGHLAHPQNNDLQDDFVQISAGADRRMQNSLHVFMEYFYRSNGETNPDDYAAALSQRRFLTDAYIARHYAGMGLQYELHPLVNINGSLIVNINDQSTLFSANLQYSLSDEADVVLGGILPVGDSPYKPDDDSWSRIRSEYGSYPGSVFLEIRFFI